MTPFIKKKEIKNNWYLVNGENLIVGRLAAYLSKVLRGKNINYFDNFFTNYSWRFCFRPIYQQSNSQH